MNSIKRKRGQRRPIAARLGYVVERSPQNKQTNPNNDKNKNKNKTHLRNDQRDRKRIKSER